MRQFGINDFWYLGNAALTTLQLSAAALFAGAILGALICLMRLSSNLLITAVATAVIGVGQGVPPLVLLFVSYFGLSFLGINVSAFIASCVALSFFAAVYLGEIWRSAVQSLPKAQWEAAESLALTWGQQMIHVIVPQAVKLAIPPSVGFTVQLIKNTSLASVVGLIELTRAGQLVNNATFQAFQVFLSVSVLYFAICFPLSALSRFLEKRVTA